MGDKVDKDAEVNELRETIKKAALPEYVEKALLKETDRLDQMPPMMAESGYCPYVYRLGPGLAVDERIGR